MTPPALGSRWTLKIDQDQRRVYVVKTIEGDRGRLRLVAEDPEATKHPHVRTTVEALKQYWIEVK